MDEDYEYAEPHMSPKEMERFLASEAKDGKTELEALRKLMYILDVSLPDFDD